MQLKQLQEGDKFMFVTPISKHRKYWIVEGQYPIKKITTVFSEGYASNNHEPIAVNNYHRVVRITPKAYKIAHRVSISK